MKQAIILLLIIYLVLTTGCSWYADTIPEPTKEVVADADGTVVKTLTYKGTHGELESIIFAINKYGDKTIARHDSLKSLGRGHTTSASSPMSSLIPWAASNFSTQEKEIRQNIAFREHLININVLTPDYQNLTPEWQGYSAIIFIIEGYEQENVNRAHELHHVFFHNIDYYQALSYEAFYTLTQEERNCMIKFLDHYNYALNQDNVIDETIAYYLQGDDQTGCFIGEGPDINHDKTITEGESYLWNSTHPQ